MLPFPLASIQIPHKLNDALRTSTESPPLNLSAVPHSLNLMFLYAACWLLWLIPMLPPTISTSVIVVEEPAVIRIPVWPELFGGILILTLVKWQAWDVVQSRAVITVDGSTAVVSIIIFFTAMKKTVVGSLALKSRPLITVEPVKPAHALIVGGFNGSPTRMVPMRRSSCSQIC